MEGDNDLGLEGGREGRSEGRGGCRCGSASGTRGRAQQALEASTIGTGGRARLAEPHCPPGASHLAFGNEMWATHRQSLSFPTGGFWKGLTDTGSVTRNHYALGEHRALSLPAMLTTFDHQSKPCVRVCVCVCAL